MEWGADAGPGPPYLGPQVVVQQLQGRQLLVHGLGVLRLLLLHDLPARLDHSLHLQLHLTQQLVQFLHPCTHKWKSEDEGIGWLVGVRVFVCVCDQFLL